MIPHRHRRQVSHDEDPVRVEVRAAVEPLGVGLLLGRDVGETPCFDRRTNTFAEAAWRKAARCCPDWCWTPPGLTISVYAKQLRWLTGEPRARRLRSARRNLYSACLRPSTTWGRGKSGAALTEASVLVPSQRDHSSLATPIPEASAYARVRHAYRNCVSAGHHRRCHLDAHPEEVTDHF